jgi:microsomal dipeptidase-like Zn-dependent dipeptidase
MALASSASTLLTACGSPCSLRIEETRDPHVLADLHAHPLLNDWIERSPLARQLPVELTDLATGLLNQTAVTFESSYRAGVDLICVAHFNLFDEWATMPTDPNPHAPANTFQMMRLLEERLEGEASRWATLARDRNELRQLLSVDKSDSKWRTAVIHSLEGGHALGGRLEPLDQFARSGVALITITHFFNKGIASSVNAYPYFPDAFSAKAHRGLSEFGAEVVAEMERLGIIVDLTHATSTAIGDVLRCSNKPLIVSHGSSAALGIHPMSLSDEHAIAIAERDGLIGVILMPYWLNNFANDELALKHGGLRDTVRTVRHFVKVTGSYRNVAIGTDFGGFITKPNDMACQAEVAVLRELLLQEFGNDEELVGALLAGNAKRFLLDNWGS